MKLSSILPLLFFLILLAMLPFVFGQLFVSAMAKLKLRPTTDLLHLKDVANIATGIGGAGTFDGIVLSGIVAAYLA